MKNDGAFISVDSERATLADVAHRADLSPATVSRYLNNPDIVSEKARTRIGAAIAALDYVPHGAARSLASRRSRMIGAVFPSLDSALFGGALEALQNEIAAAGYTLVVASSGYDSDREREQIQTLLANGVDGLMLVGGARPPEVFDLIRRKAVPYVLIWVSETSDPHPCIGFDNAAAAAEVTRHLTDMGHRRIAVVSGPLTGNDRASGRITGIRSALGERGLTLDPRYVIERPFGVEEGREALRLLWSREPRPTAVICGSEPFAYGVLFEAQAQGIRIPKDLSVTGFDDIWLSSQMTPSLTTVRTPRREMGRLAGRYLLSVLAGKETVLPRPLDVELIARQSTSPPPPDAVGT